MPVLAAIYGERKRLAGIVSKEEKGIGSPQITVGLISGGINTNVVPDRITFRIDRRIVPEENGVEVEKALVALIAAALPKGQGMSVESRRIMLAEPLRPLPGVDGIVAVIRGTRRRSSVSMSRQPASRSTPTPATTRRPAFRPCSTAPARVRSSRQTPTAPTSTCKLSDLRAATEVIAVTLADLLRGI